MWILRIIWADDSETIRAYSTKKLCELMGLDFKKNFGCMIKGYDIYKRSYVYYG